MTDSYDWYFDFLNDLRESGKCNMFEAPSVMQKLFGLSRKESLMIFQEWTKQFGKEKVDS